MNSVTRLRGAGEEPPPQLVNYDAEQAFLGACLANNEVWHVLADRLRPEHFADALHARIYEAIGKLIQRGIRADVITLKKQFDQDGALVEIGGAGYLVELAESVVTVINASDYGEQVIDLWRRREITAATREAAERAALFSPEEDATAVVESLEQRLAEIASSGVSQRAIITAADAAIRATESAEAVVKSGGTTGVPTGIADLDRILGGLQPSDLVILAGRPSMGKTALAVNIGFNAASRHRRDDDRPYSVVAFSLEMSAEQLGQRLISMGTGIPVDRQRSGFATQEEIASMVEASARLHDLPFWIDDDASVTVQGMTARARRIKRRHGLDLCIVDHLGRARTPKGEKLSGLYERTTGIVRDFKTMAKALGVPVLLLVQLSRSVEQRDDKHPQLADLRDSGAIEEEADVVMFVYREEYYLERAEPKPNTGESDEKYHQRKVAWDRRLLNARNVAEVIVAKNRQGPIRSTKIRFDGPKQLFQDLHQQESVF